MVNWGNFHIIIIIIRYCFHSRYVFYGLLDFHCGVRFDPPDITCYPNMFRSWVKHVVVDVAHMVVSVSHKDACFSMVIQLVLYCLCIMYDAAFAKCS